MCTGVNVCACVRASVRASVLKPLSVCRVNELYVDDPDKDSGGKIDVSLNITLANLNCDREYIYTYI